MTRKASSKSRRNDPAPLRTLIFCTTYSVGTWLWQARYRRWLDAVRAHGFGQTQIVMVDDGSPVLPGWPDCDIITVHSLAEAVSVRSDAPLVLFRFPTPLGRISVVDFPGWHRSFAFAALYAQARGFQRVIHIESDAYIISGRLSDWVRNFTSGWVALWSPKYLMPEMAIQCVGPDQIDAFAHFARAPYAELAGRSHELALPLTHVERTFTGDRYGEEGTVPSFADYATQIPSDRVQSYYWWLNENSGESVPETSIPAAVSSQTPRTLLFCTAYAKTPLMWERRYRRWIDAVRQSDLGQTQIILVDDGSPILPGWSDCQIVGVSQTADATRIRTVAPLVLFHFHERLGRTAIYDFPGWYRSWAFAVQYAQSQRFEKAIHIESDAYVVSTRLRDWIRNFNKGWAALWSEKYNIPESAIQIVGADQIALAADFFAIPYDRLIDVPHETAIPFTHVEREFVGDRFGEEDNPIPASADYAAQVPPQREPSYYWWLQGASGPPEAGGSRKELTFGREDGNGVSLFGDGWARPEPKGTWMINLVSALTLPRLAPPAGDVVDLTMTMSPHANRDTLPFQRLFLQLNATNISEFELPQLLTIGCEFPYSLLRTDGDNKLRFVHPDAASPAQFGANSDTRKLSFMLRKLVLQPRKRALAVASSDRVPEPAEG